MSANVAGVRPTEAEQCRDRLDSIRMVGVEYCRETVQPVDAVVKAVVP